MKTQIALLVTVITSIPFWGGCASTELTDVKTYKLSELATNDGVWHNKLSNSRKPITCRVVKWIDGELFTEFFLKDGIKNGRFREWHVEKNRIKKGHPHIDAVYENGEIVRLRKYWWNSDTPGETGHMWWNETEWQLILKGWNKDGTPAPENPVNPIKK